jgi:predicted aconitase
MSTDTTDTTPAPVALGCPSCGSTELVTIAALLGSASGRAELLIGPGGELDATFHHDGDKNVDWARSRTVGVGCRSCCWFYQGPNHLDQLIPATREEN